MNALRKVLVVDDGQRGRDDLLSSELAGLGLSSVTTSVEAARQVLDLIDTPSAIFLSMPQLPGAEHNSMLNLAEQLRGQQHTSGIPIIMWDRTAALLSGGVSTLLRTEIGPQALAEPER